MAPGTLLGRGYRGLLEGLGLLAGCAFAGIALLVSVDVVLRNLGLGNLPWLIEVAEYVLYGATFLAAPWVLHHGGHVRVDLLLTRLPRPLARAAETLADLLGLLISVLLAWYGARAALDAHAVGALVFKHLVLPEWPLLALLPLAATLLAAEFVRRLWRVLREGPGAAAGGG